MCAAESLASSLELQSPAYQRRTPETTCLYGIISCNLESTLAHAREKSNNGMGYPWFVEREFYKYLDCGQLRCGFIRVKCKDCSTEKLVAFSCKGRGLCPSCTARRMSNTAAHLVDNVLPQVPYRQWVMSFPRRVRFLLACNAGLLDSVLQMMLRKVFAWQRRRGRSIGITLSNDSMSGAVTFVQRFGSLLNLNVHFHSLLPDGLFQEHDGTILFCPIPPPSREDIERLVKQIAVATEKLLARFLERDSFDEQPSHLTNERAQSLKFASTERPKTPTGRASTRVAFLQGYSLHAERIVLSNDREGLERLCRYGARAPISQSRLSLDEQGNAIIKLKRTYFDGRTELKFTQEQLLQKLALLIPPPWKNLTRYHGVFAPNHRHRAVIVGIGRPPPKTKACEITTPTPRRLPWAMLLRRVFAIDVLRCSTCSGPMSIIAVILPSEASCAILNHLALAEPEPNATGPPGNATTNYS